MKKLTIGMAVYEDFDGLYFSIQALRYYHQDADQKRLEFLVIDNCPNGKHSKTIETFVKNWVPGGRYICTDEVKGTAVRDLIFREAKTDYVLCMDSHVLLEPGALKSLLNYYDAHPDTNDFIQGPLVQDDIRSMSSFMKLEWRQGMYGTWEKDDRALNKNGEPFDIPNMGLGLFTCRKDAWLGFNKNFRGFGGEEYYIHEKFRQAGRRTLCLPSLRWLHRFFRPLGTIYKNTWEDRIRNYLIGWDEIGKMPTDIVEHFTTLTSTQVMKTVIDNLNAEKILKRKINYDGTWEVIKPDVKIEVQTPTRNPKVYIFGSPGSGATTLGAKLSKVTGVQAYSVENFMWKISNPPLTQRFSAEDTQKALMASLKSNENWILSGSMEDWRDPFVPLFGHVIFLDAPVEERLKRITERETKRWGEQIAANGLRHKSYLEQLKSAEKFDLSEVEWLKTLKCPVLRINGLIDENDALKAAIEFLTKY